jgi:paraquat-inducible protein A
MAEPRRGRRSAAALARGWDRLAPLGVLVAFALLAAGLWLPIMSVERFFVFSSAFSIYESIRALWSAGEYFLFAAVLLFSVVFPVAKLLGCLVLWFAADARGAAYARVAAIMDQLGRWSMMDVFLLAILLVIVRSTALGGARTEAGLYAFTAAVVVSILTVQWIRAAGRRLTRG